MGSHCCCAQCIASGSFGSRGWLGEYGPPTCLAIMKNGIFRARTPASAVHTRPGQSQGGGKMDCPVPILNCPAVSTLQYRRVGTYTLLARIANTLSCTYNVRFRCKFQVLLIKTDRREQSTHCRPTWHCACIYVYVSHFATVPHSPSGQRAYIYIGIPKRGRPGTKAYRITVAITAGTRVIKR